MMCIELNLLPSNNTIKEAKALKFTGTSTTPLLQLTPLSLLPLLPRSWDTLLTVSSSEED